MKMLPLVGFIPLVYVHLEIYFCNLELHVKTVKYFKSIERVQIEVEQMQRQLQEKE